MQHPTQQPKRHTIQSFLENLPAAAYTCDAEGLITYFNEAAVRVWGRAPRLNDPVDRFCGSFKLFASDGSPIAHDRCWMALALQDRKSYNGQEIVIERPDGSRKSTLAYASPILEESGKLSGAINVLVDVSDLHRASEAESLLAAIVKSSDDAIYSRDLEGRILTWNVGAERLYGYEPSEAIGQPITLITPIETLKAEQEIVQRLCFYERVEHFETVRIAKGGRPVDVSITISPIHDGTGRIVGISKIARDITARKQADAAFVALKDELAVQLADLRRLHEMSMRLSITLELAPILNETLRTAAAIEGTDLGMIFLRSAESDSLSVGASMGFTDDFLSQRESVPLGDRVSEVSFQEKRRVVVEDLEADPRYVSYRQIACKAGIRALHCTPLITRYGAVVGVLSTHFRRPHRPSDREMHLIDLCARHAVDFIENARLYNQLKEADRRKDEFLATLAHELRNPLAPISNALHILRLSGDLPPAAESVREIMERQVNHLVRLVDDLLEVSRITRGKIELRKLPVELAAIVESAVETSRPVIEAAGHQLAISIATERIALEADAVRIAQVISNLLNNAAKYTDKGGQIWLTARRDRNEAVISVRDSGVGIPAEMLPRVFEMFTQVDRTLNRAQGGLGIGLTLSKNLVRMHGGTIEAHSEGLGQGSEFIVRLPLAGEPARSAAVPRTPSLQKRDLPARRILVVDDTQAAAYILGRLLEALGQQVTTAENAESALQLARQQPPDLVISDIAMPNVDGYELARRMRQEPALKDSVLVALTGYCQDSDRQRTKQAGYDYHLVKPVSLEALSELLATLPISPYRGKHADRVISPLDSR